MNATDAGGWPIAGAAAPKVKPPASAAPLLRNSLRAGRFESMGLSLLDEPTWNGFRAVGRLRPSRGRIKPAYRRASRKRQRPDAQLARTCTGSLPASKVRIVAFGTLL